MQDINYWAVLAAVVAAFVASSVYYILFAKQYAKLSPAAAGAADKPEPAVMIAELARNVLLAFVIAYLVDRLGINDLVGAVGLGLILWVGFPFILLGGSILHEKYPWRLAAIHAGDWLLKLLLMVLIVGLWQ
jgi:hypothetical protein